jgi:hypothetical protein
VTYAKDWKKVVESAGAIAASCNGGEPTALSKNALLSPAPPRTPTSGSTPKLVAHSASPAPRSVSSNGTRPASNGTRPASNGTPDLEAVLLGQLDSSGHNRNLTTVARKQCAPNKGEYGSYVRYFKSDAIERLDQGHLYPNLEVPGLICPSRELNPGLTRGKRAL